MIMLVSLAAVAVYVLVLMSIEGYRPAALVCYWSDPGPPMAVPIPEDPKSIRIDEGPRYAPTTSQSSQRPQTPSTPQTPQTPQALQTTQMPTKTPTQTPMPSPMPFVPPTLQPIQMIASVPQVSMGLSSVLTPPPLPVPTIPPKVS